ncbi:MAG: cytochrome c3 family protein, partial [Candidatus Aminicenantaceae bacterium]
MIKKPHIIGSIVIVAAFAFVLVTTGTTQQMTTQSIKSHIEALWAHSGHANAEGEAFRHWDEDGEVQASCSKCHASEGYVYFIENDGATKAVHPEQEGITCQACHTDPDSGTLRNHTDVEFPSGVVVEGLGPEALCSECHQGRMSGPGVDDYIEGRAAEGEDEDTINSSY